MKAAQYTLDGWDNTSWTRAVVFVGIITELTKRVGAEVSSNRAKKYRTRFSDRGQLFEVREGAMNIGFNNEHADVSHGSLQLMQIPVCKSAHLRTAQYEPLQKCRSISWEGLMTDFKMEVTLLMEVQNKLCAPISRVSEMATICNDRGLEFASTDKALSV